MVHLRDLQLVAEADPTGARSVATGYNASAEYVIDTLAAADTGGFFEVTSQFFVVPIYEEVCSRDPKSTYQPGCFV